MAAFLKPWQQLVGQTVKGTTGIDLSPEAIQDKSLFEQAASKPAEFMGAGIGGFAKSLGIDPKMLLILGGVGVGLVVLLVVMK